MGVPSFLSGGGIYGELARSVDWSRTALGPPESWAREPEDDRRNRPSLAAPHVPVLGRGADPALQRRVHAELRRRQAPGGDGATRARVLAGDLADHRAADRRRDAARKGELERRRPRPVLTQRSPRGDLLELASPSSGRSRRRSWPPKRPSMSRVSRPRSSRPRPRRSLRRATRGGPAPASGTRDGSRSATSTSTSSLRATTTASSSA
jgi:hypothetical protein